MSVCVLVRTWLNYALRGLTADILVCVGEFAGVKPPLATLAQFR